MMWVAALGGTRLPVACDRQETLNCAPIAAGKSYSLSNHVEIGCLVDSGLLSSNETMQADLQHLICSLELHPQHMQ